MKILLAIFGLLLSAVSGAANPTSVVVLANRDLPKSVELAKFYLKKRGIPERNLIALPMPIEEAISRKDYEEQIEKPLLHVLRDRNLIKQRMRAKIFGGERSIEWATSEVHFYALVSMYGVPVKILDTKPKLAQAVQNRTGFSDKMMHRNGAAVDAELSCLLLDDYSRAGPLPNPWYNSQGFTQIDKNKIYLLATRLDGPTPQIVRNMIEGALEVEKYGLRGGCYIDKFGPFKMGDIWMEEAYQRLKRLGMEMYTNPIVDTTWSEDYPMEHPAIYLGWYAPEVNGPFLRDDLQFAPGAIAYHLHSFSAMELRTDKKFWVGPLLAKGAAATMGCVDEPYLHHTPDLAIFASRLGMGYSFGEAAYMSLRSLSWQITVIGDPLYTPFRRQENQQLQRADKDDLADLDWLLITRINRLARDSQLHTAMDMCRNGIRATNSWRLREKLGDLYASNGMHRDALVEFSRLLPQLEHPAALTRIGAKIILLYKLLGSPNDAEELTKQLKEKLGDSPLTGYLDDIKLPAHLTQQSAQEPARQQPQEVPTEKNIEPAVKAP